MKPIWKDDGYTFATDTLFTVWLLDSLNAKVSQVYSGRAIPNPVTNTATVYLNRLVQTYLAQHLTESGQEDADICLNFGMYNSSDTLLKREEYYMDWSYGGLAAPSGLGIWVDMGDHPAGMPVILSLDPGSYDLTISNDLSTYTFTTATGSNVFIDGQPLHASITVTDSISTTSRVIVQRSYCSTHALYFVNAFGGWSTLPLAGQHTTEDSLTRSTYEKDYDNAVPTDRSRVNYLNAFDRKYTFHTFWLTDEVSRNMEHLFTSTLVYLYDSATGDFTPVTLTGTSFIHRDYRNGRQMISYDITATEARQYIRR